MFSEDLYGLLVSDYFHDLQSIINFSLTTKYNMKFYAKNFDKIEEKYLTSKRITSINIEKMIKSIIKRNVQYLSKCFRISEKHFLDFEDCLEGSGVRECLIVGLSDEERKMLSNTDMYVRIETYNYTVMYFYQEKACDPLHVININKFPKLNEIFNGKTPNRISSYQLDDINYEKYPLVFCGIKGRL